MNNSEAADQVVSMSLKSIEVVAKIAGVGAKNLAAYLYAVLKQQKKTKGKTRLESLLRSGKELKVFAVRNEDLQKFCQEAKRYGVLYCALRDKKSADGLCDIMVRAEDASKINRIVDRFKLATVNTAKIKTEIEKSRSEKQTQKAPAEKVTPAEKTADAFLDDLLSQPQKPEPEKEVAHNPNPTVAPTEKSHPSEPISGPSERSAEGAIEPERKSVRQELKEIRDARGKQAEKKPVSQKEQVITPPAIPKREGKFKKYKER